MLSELLVAYCRVGLWLAVYTGDDGGRRNLGRHLHTAKVIGSNMTSGFVASDTTCGALVLLAGEYAHPDTNRLRIERFEKQPGSFSSDRHGAENCGSPV
jgi:hypothetical protein